VLREALYKNTCLSHVALGGNEFKATDWENLGKGRSAKVNAQVCISWGIFPVEDSEML
jgi:hypothetical protein